MEDFGGLALEQCDANGDNVDVTSGTDKDEKLAKMDLMPKYDNLLNNIEVKDAISEDEEEEELDEPQRKLNHSEPQTIGSKQRDLSTCGGVRSIGSDLTRMIGKSDAYQNRSVRTDHTVVKMKEHGTPTSRAQPAASRQSFAQVMEIGRTNGNRDNCNESDAIMCSKSSSQSKRSRKASAVKDPILQYTKRQKAQVA
ncbi:hypothetical protein ACET3Z_030267 [Daucus carota]